MKPSDYEEFLRIWSRTPSTTPPDDVQQRGYREGAGDGEG